jgi:NADH dehydrogenase [ubiquinone] 1 alpha subcomplex assembly factor 7
MTDAAAHTTTPLARQLIERIKRTGPISVGEYMRACLDDPEHGYYRRMPAIGRGGDFVTAPEISQVFGELVGLWCAVLWQQMGSPDPVRLIELGPGRGTLMRDALRAIRLVPAFRAAVQVELVESNTPLEAMQRATLGDEGVPMRWMREPEPGTDAVILIGNEFLDTIPLEQWERRGDAWHERRVGTDPHSALVFTKGAERSDIKPSSNTAAPRDGDILESRAEALSSLADRLAKLGRPLAAIFIDYGHTQPGFGDTLQAVGAHRYQDPLAAPGEHDLTAQVDFAEFADIVRARGLAVDGPLTQAEFLGRLGIIERASRLMDANPSKAGEIEAGVLRLIAPGGMGSRFHAVGIRSVDVPPLPAFAAVDTGAARP